MITVKEMMSVFWAIIQTTKNVCQVVGDVCDLDIWMNYIFPPRMV